jgi:imidazolonepropionase-like amidohydrolase
VPSLVISGTEIFDGSGTALVRGHAVVIEGARIVGVVPQDEIGADGDGVRLLLPGTTLLPGLIDLHTHLAHGTGGMAMGVAPYSTPAQVAVHAVGNAQAAHRSGVTTLRDLGGPYGVAQAVRDAVASGQITGPRLAAAGQAICATGSAFARPPLTGFGCEADGPDGCRQAVRNQVKTDADLIKVVLDGVRGIIEFTQPELDAIVDEAHRCNRLVACHATRPETIGMALEAGADTIEHGGIQFDQATMARMADLGTVLVPTILATTKLTKHMADDYFPAFQHLPQERLEAVIARRLASFFRSVTEAGIVIGAGTDHALKPGGYASLADELAAMVEMGLSPVRALVTATSVAARALARGHELGRVSRGALADLIVCAGNPAQDISALKDILLVVQDGKPVFADRRIASALPWALPWALPDASAWLPAAP